MAKEHIFKPILPPPPRTGGWTKKIMGEGLIQKGCAENKATSRLSELISHNSRLFASDLQQPNSIRAILSIASEWDVYLETIPTDELELARPPFIRFIDIVISSIDKTDNHELLTVLFEAITLPQVLMFDLDYTLKSLFNVFTSNSDVSKGMLAFSYLEEYSMLLYSSPPSFQKTILSGMLEFYEQNPRHLYSPVSINHAKSISSFLFAHKEHLLERNELNLLAYGIAWGIEEVNYKLSFMEDVADTCSTETQIALFSRVIELIPIIPIYVVPNINELNSDKLKDIAPELRDILITDFKLSFIEASSKQIRLFRETNRLLGLTGTTFMDVSANDSVLQ